jgi:hypothetical protein
MQSAAGILFFKWWKIDGFTMYYTFDGTARVIIQWPKTGGSEG